MVDFSRRCPKCGAINDCHTHVGLGDVAPSPGDASVCLYCETILVFGDDMSLRVMDEGEFKKLSAEHRAEIAKARLMAILFNIKKRNQTPPSPNWTGQRFPKAT